MPWYRHLLWPFAILYGLGVGFRDLLFDVGVLSSKKFEVPVICIGNLETGGTGKSPLVNYIVRVLLDKGKKVAVISRGYGRKTAGFQMVEGNSLAENVGDEPLQLKLRLPNAVVAVCEKRAVGIQRLLELDPNLDFVIMDDGFQHRWVKPSLSILVTSANLPCKQNYLLPVGNLREPRSASNRADLIVRTGVIEGSQDRFKALQDGFCTKTSAGDLVLFYGKEKTGIMDSALPKSVLVFSGIANSDRFDTILRDKMNVLEHVEFADHHNYTISDVKMLRKKMDSFGAAVHAVITTEKDAARFWNTSLLNEFGKTPVYYLPIDLEFLNNQADEFEKLILDHGKHA